MCSIPGAMPGLMGGMAAQSPVAPLLAASPLLPFIRKSGLPLPKFLKENK